MLGVEQQVEPEVGRSARSVDHDAGPLLLGPEHGGVEPGHGRPQYPGRLRPPRWPLFDTHPSIVPGGDPEWRRFWPAAAGRRSASNDSVFVFVLAVDDRAQTGV